MQDLALPPGLEMADLNPALALELAAQLSDPDQVMARHGLSEEKFRALLSNVAFQKMVKDAQRTWSSDMNAEERVRLKALLSIEESLPQLFVFVHDTEINITARLEASKQLTSLAGLGGRGGKDGAAAGGSGLSVTINLGPNPEDKVVIQGEAA